MTTRIRLLPILATLLTLALIAAGCGGDGGGGGGGGDAKALLEKGFKTQVDSGQLKLDISARLDGVERLKGPISLKLAGPFKGNGDKRLPSLDWKITAEGAGQKLDAGVVVTESNAFVSLQGQNYELGSALFKRFVGQFAKQSGKQQSVGQFGLDPASWLKDPKIEDGDDIGGEATRKVSGEVDVKTLVKDLIGAFRSPALKRQLESQGQTLPAIPEVKDEDIQKVEDAVKDLEFEANVDGNDVVRRVFVKAGFEVPEDARSGAGGLEGGEVTFGYVLEKVGIDPTIKPPSNPQPLSGLLQQFGLGGGLALPQQQ